jgi:hypothetical protein
VPWDGCWVGRSVNRAVTRLSREWSLSLSCCDHIFTWLNRITVPEIDDLEFRLQTRTLLKLYSRNTLNSRICYSQGRYCETALVSWPTMFIICSGCSVICLVHINADVIRITNLNLARRPICLWHCLCSTGRPFGYLWTKLLRHFDPRSPNLRHLLVDA